jgi:hypothetical protein
MSGEALFLADILGGRENRDERDNFSASDARSFDDDDAEQFSTATIKSAGDDEQSDDSSARPTYVCASIPPSVPHASNVPTEISVQNQPAPPLIPTFVNHPNVVPTATVDESLPIPRGKSLAHHYIKTNKVVYCSFDLEHGGEYCGVIQISAQLFRPNIADITGQDFVRVEKTFNQYIQPPEGAIWNEAACQATHKLHANSPQIRAANPFDFVWHEFCAYIADHVSPSETCIFVAYHGETCDLRWIWKHTVAMPYISAQWTKMIVTVPIILCLFEQTVGTSEFTFGLLIG